MPPLAVWGPIIWKFFHTLSQKIKDESYPIISVQLFTWLRSICKTLPCPECSQHATSILNRIIIQNIKTKQEFCMFMATFHNIVNKRKQKQIFDGSYGMLTSVYGNENLIHRYNKFMAVFQESSGVKLQTDSFYRKIVATNFKKWLLANISHFNP
jgi:hypothetical protein